MPSCETVQGPGGRSAHVKMPRLCGRVVEVALAVETTYVTINGVSGGSVHVDTSVRWMERHIREGASPDEFITTAQSTPSKIFSHSSALSSASVSTDHIMAGGAVTVSTPSYPPPLSPCQELEPCYPGVACADNQSAPGGFSCGQCPRVTCTQTDLGPVCGECPVGFAGDGSSGCIDIDGCAHGPCFSGVECADIGAPGLGHTCGSCPEGHRGDGETCALCRMLVGIDFTTAVQGKVQRTGWNRGERELIGGRNDGLDDAAYVNELGMRFWWSGAASDGTVMQLGADLHKANTLTLNLPKSELQVDRTYTFRLSAAMVGNSAVAAAATVAFYMESQPLDLVIRGGAVSTGEQSPITLDATESVDPDGESGDIRFSWSCFPQGGGGECRYPNGSALPTHFAETVIQVSLEGGQPARNYTFTLQGRKGPRSSSKSTQVSITSGAPPVPQIAPLQAAKVNAEEVLRLRGEAAAVDITTLAYEWTVAARDSSRPLELAGGVLASADRFQSSLALQAGALMPGGVYTFQLAARDSFGEGTVQITVKVNAPPSGGWVQAIPRVGLAYTDRFALSAAGWTDPEEDKGGGLHPLDYKFACRGSAWDEAREAAVLRDYSPLQEVGTILPEEGLVTVTVEVRDALGAAATAAVNVTATPLAAADGSTSLQTASSDLSGMAAASLREGNTETAMVQVDAAASLLSAQVKQEQGEGAASSARKRRRRLAEDAEERMQQRRELLESVAAVKSMTFPTSSVAARLAASLTSLVADVQELTVGSQEQALALLEGLVGDALADPAGAELTAGAAQAVCASLASLNGIRNESRASQVVKVMTEMAESLVANAAPGEQASEVSAPGLALKAVEVQRAKTETIVNIQRVPRFLSMESEMNRNGLHFALEPPEAYARVGRGNFPLTLDSLSICNIQPTASA
ncbi:hypothetical protein CYMTET_27129 [Cymbomonas tetramitiformis]|uniref:PKD/REJ-like domain-containing protein n=1 Tax=Cymbomonas tetramitiformis TaxID=36881 RepID=A0AAE0KXA5_9CHLO|nr:hypothetical protein CYMTET_27129 [Cymbomonas tetramitiformis]